MSLVSAVCSAMWLCPQIPGLNAPSKIGTLISRSCLWINLKPCCWWLQVSTVNTEKPFISLLCQAPHDSLATYKLQNTGKLGVMLQMLEQENLLEKQLQRCGCFTPAKMITFFWVPNTVLEAGPNDHFSLNTLNSRLQSQGLSWPPSPRHD